MNRYSFLLVAVLNFLAAIAFIITVVLSEKSTHQWGFSLVAFMFAVGGVGNLVLHFKQK
ncbi:hypothetical protein MKX64_09370 [Paenibacillus sp. FSL M8-0334]|uniref:hypothetical protein n=1 Tax=Paenibacillus TaxID=44249 RepID=UPI0018C31638|nr:hypothetical protein [Paenibacillus campinasensis]